MMSAADGVTVDLDILHIIGVSGHSLEKRDGSILHFFPRCHVDVRGVEVDPRAGSIGAWIVLRCRVDPALFRIPRLRAGVTNHLTNRPKGDWNPRGVLIGSKRIQQ